MIISSNKKNQQTCCEYTKCPDRIRRQCDIYDLSSGKECWLFVDTEKGGPHSHDGGCLYCPWFKKNHP